MQRCCLQHCRRHCQGEDQQCQGAIIAILLHAAAAVVPHKRGRDNYAKALSSALPPLSLLSREHGAIDVVKAPSPLPSHALLHSPLLREQGVDNSAKETTLSTREQGTADNNKAPCHHRKSRGHLTAPRRYRTGRC